MASPETPPPGPAPGSSGDSEPVRKLIGTVIGGRYKVLSLIGEGGMGAVFLVEHTVMRKRMALKVLNDQMMKNAEAIGRFEREALAAAHIDHPNVVAATDSGRTEGGSLFVVLEYVDGQSLRDWLADGSMTPSLVVHIARQVTSALVRAHGMGIIHRDLKPENIMLVSRDDDHHMVKVLDFGLAKLSVRALLDGSEGSASTNEIQTRYGAVFGTPAYMAPEQAAGGEVDGRTDLYALGVVMYEMLTGKLPFDGDDSAALLRQHVVAKVPPIRERMPGLKVPDALEAMVLRLLEKRPDKRFENARALLEAIDGLLATENLRHEPISPTIRIKGPGRVRAAEAEQKATVVAPDDLAAKKFAAAAVAETQVEASLSGPQAKAADGKQAKAPEKDKAPEAGAAADKDGDKDKKPDDPTPSADGGESLALALKDLTDLAGPKAQDGPTLDGLAEQFGAASSHGAPSTAPPPLLGKGTKSDPPLPKLRAPSSIDLQVLQPEAAAVAVLTPAPPPTLGERVRDARIEAMGWWRGTGWPKLQAAVKQGVTAVRTHAPRYFAKLLSLVRSRLPEKHRGISERTLGLAVGAALLLPLLILILVLALSGGSSSGQGSTTAALPGFASDREMERGVSGGVRDLEKLANKYPSDSRIFRALARGHAARKNYGAALRALTSLARLDPTMASDDEMSQIAAAAAVLPETSDAAIALLESSLGDKGVSVLSDLADRTPTEPWKSKLSASLQKGTVRALASEATLILIDLRAADTCEAKRGLLRRASQQGDARTLSYLQGLQSTTGCPPHGEGDCWPCLHKGTALQATIDTVQKRLGS